MIRNNKKVSKEDFIKELNILLPKIKELQSTNEH